MAIELNQEDKTVKSHKSKAYKGCSATLVIQIIFTIGLVFLALAPVLSIFLGVFTFALYIVGAAVSTVCTLFVALASKGFREFWAKAWQVMVVNVFKGAGTIRSALKPHIIWLSIVLLVISSIGFIYNLVYFIKKEKENKGKFIASCIFFGIALIAAVVCMPIYLA